MFKIIVPIDFSPESLVAAEFAGNLARQIKAPELVIFHSILIKGITKNMFKKIEDILFKEAGKELENVRNEVKRKTNYSGRIKLILLQGNPSETILEFSKNSPESIVIMASGGNSKYHKMLLGSITNKVLNHSSSPVIVLPKDMQTKGIRHIVYASDLIHLNEETALMVDLARLLKADLHVVHIYPEALDAALFDVEAIQLDLRKKYAYDFITFYAGMNRSVVQGIKEYVAEFNPDILVMYTNHANFFDDGNDESVTSEYIRKIDVPLMSIPYDE